MAYRDDRVAPGAVPGVDTAGTVVRVAADGSGPPVGTRVSGFAGGGAWAELRPVGTGDLAVVPDQVDIGIAAALPGAGVTALHACRRLGTLLGRRVLVTAVQLAVIAGAEVVAAVGSRERGKGLAALGAHQVVTELREVGGPVHAVLDVVGRPLLAEALTLLDGGPALSIGMASGTTTTLDLEAARVAGGRWWLVPFAVSAPFAPDLESLLGLVGQGRLDPQIGDAIAALQGRTLRGKAVLDVG